MNCEFNIILNLTLISDIILPYCSSHKITLFKENFLGLIHRFGIVLNDFNCNWTELINKIN